MIFPPGMATNSMRGDPNRSLLGYLVRHGEITAGNKWDGWGNYDLTKEGIEHAERDGQWLAFEKIGRIISSDVPRTMHTADIIMQYVHPSCPMISYDPNLRPLMVAKFTGQEKTAERLKEFEYYIQNPDIPIPDGESINQLNDRSQVIGVYLATPYDGKITVIVCHNSIIKSFMGIPEIKEAVEPGGVVAVYMNEKGGFEFEVVLGAVALQEGVS